MKVQAPVHGSIAEILIAYYFFFKKEKKKSGKTSWILNIVALTHSSGDGIFLLTRSWLSIDFSHGDLFEGRPLFDLKEEECLKESLTADQTDSARYGCCIHAFGRDIVALIYLHFLKVKVSSHKHTDLFPPVWFEQLMQTISAAGRAAPTRCHCPLNAAWRPNVNIDFTVWRSGKCVWDGYVHSGGPRQNFQPGKFPAGPRTNVFAPFSRF